MNAHWRVSLLLPVVVLLVAAAASAQSLSRVVFFGDSLSDSGNHFIQYGTSSRQPFSFDAPEDSYDIGGHHFSNGNTWAEQLAAALHMPTSAGPSLRTPGVFTNYAVGRARARSGAPVFPYFDLRTQVDNYLADVGGEVTPGTLVAIWIGGDDLGDALSALAEDPSGATSVGILQNALAATVDSIAVLYGAGARTFLIVNIPDLAYTPYVRYIDAHGYPGSMAAATLLTNSYDTALAQSIALLPSLLPQAAFIELNANALIGEIVNSPESFGIADTSERCTTPGVIGGAICATPNRYLFWDATHPTTAAHGAVAQAALQLLASQ